MNNGTSISKGIGIGKPFIIKTFSWPEEAITDQVESELVRLKNGIIEACDELDKTYDTMLEKLGEEHAEIFSAHRMLIEDEAFIDSIESKIKINHYTADYATKLVTDEFVELFKNMKNEYFKERSADMLDVGKRLVKKLIGYKEVNMDSSDDIIIVANDLTPSDTAKLNPEVVKGFITEIGGKTSHTAIIANMLGIPAVSGIDVSLIPKDTKEIIVDGTKGKIYVDPTQKIINKYEEKIMNLKKQIVELKSFINKSATTPDGITVKVNANIMMPDNMDAVIKEGASGVGLFRSEFIFMNREEAPSEESQFLAYKRVAMANLKDGVIIRTLDVGGDKELDYLGIPKEDNPFLGFRAIRYCLEHKDVFKVQIRAILRASAFGQLKIMFPMISTYEEIIEAKSVVEDVKNELAEEGIKFDRDIPVGIMIEVPSAAMISDILAKEVDFFSIGTNDLIQYTMAVDRMNEHVSGLYQEYHPGVLRLIHQVIKNGKENGIEVGMCGSSAANERLTPVYLAMGLEKFSVNPRDVLRIKKEVCETYMDDANVILEKVLACKTAEEVAKSL